MTKQQVLLFLNRLIEPAVDHEAAAKEKRTYGDRAAQEAKTNTNEQHALRIAELALRQTPDDDAIFKT